MPSRRSLLASFILAGLGAAVLPACAAGGLVDVQIVDRTQGNLLEAHRHRGAIYVAGQPGNRYAVQMTNRTAARVLVVLSVDGINAISGDTAAVGQTGYVLGPWQSAEITGWRKSNTEAAAFYFTSLADSYAARTDRPDNVGVIGAAVFRERVVRVEPQSSYNASPPYPARQAPVNEAPSSRLDRATGAADAAPAGPMAPAAERAAGATPPSPSARDAAPSDSDSRLRLGSEATAKSLRLGTGHGEREYSPTSQVAFERASSQPAELVQMRYDSRSNLVAMGVIGGRPLAWTPEAFPRFTPDPR